MTIGGDDVVDVVDVIESVGRKPPEASSILATALLNIAFVLVLLMVVLFVVVAAVVEVMQSSSGRMCKRELTKQRATETGIEPSGYAPPVTLLQKVVWCWCLVMVLV